MSTAMLADACSDTIVCACFQIAESTVVDAIATWNLTSVKEVCRMTNAGAGCTACRLRLRKYVEEARTE
jgi:bacterioferritin-associated ferredoxin